MAIFTPEELKLLNNASLAADKFRQAKKLIAEGIKLLGGTQKAPKASTAGLSAAAKKTLTALGAGSHSAPELRALTKLKPDKQKAALNELRAAKLATLSGHGRGARWSASKRQAKVAAQKVEELLSSAVH